MASALDHWANGIRRAGIGGPDSLRCCSKSHGLISPTAGNGDDSGRTCGDGAHGWTVLHYENSATFHCNYPTPRTALDECVVPFRLSLRSTAMPESLVLSESCLICMPRARGAD